MKIAISIPREDYLLLEKLRLKLRFGRSRLIQEAIRCWLDARKQKILINKYEAGYRKKPEKFLEVKAIERAQYDVLSDGGWR